MKHEFKIKQYKDATVYTLESASGGATGSGAVASVSSPIGGVRKRGDNLIAQEEKKEAPKPRNFVAKNAKMGGAGAHKDKKKAAKQGEVKHKKPLAESYAEQLAKQVFDHKPDLDNEDAILNLGYNIAKSELGSRAQGIFRDEDFPSDFVSAYSYLKNQGVAEDHEIQMASSELQSIAKNAVHLLDLVRKYSEQEGLEAWQQSKITKAADYLNAVLQSISGKQSNISENDLAQQMMATARSLGMNPRVRGTPDQERERTQQMLAQRAKDREEQERQAGQADAAKLPELKAEYERMKKEYEALGGSNWQYADREQNLSDAERKARSMEPALRTLATRIHRAEQGDAYMEQLASKVAEKLNPNAPTDVWVKDFQKANPNKYHQFKNKTPAKKAQMAVAAHYAANEPNKKK